jgi:hypothetical protein
MNNLSHTIRRFNRFEIKYLLTLKQASRFKEHLRAYLIADEHGGRTGHYTVTNLYYDSPDYRCFQEMTLNKRTRKQRVAKRPTSPL